MCLLVLPVYRIS